MRLLIIDDNQQITDVLKSGLESDCFVVDVANNGETGLKFAQENKYDLIILDLILPKEDGTQVCTKLRAMGNATPIIILSVKANIPDKVELLNIGADDYITKPFSFSELMARINAILRRPNQLQRQPCYQVEDLELDINAHSVKRKGQEIHLTRKEFLILNYLIKNRGRVATRQMILENAWDINADPFSNTIEAHIRNLRKKIDEGHKKRYIQTVAGVGYKIN